MIRERSQNPLENTGDASDDARNVDDQLDEEMRQHDEATQQPLPENHTNNAHVEPRDASAPPNLPPKE